MVQAPGKRRTQEERKAESERQILRAAISLFSKQGYLRTTLNEVGEAAGYTGGLVSHRFGSKEGLLHAVVDHIAKRFLHDQLGAAIERESAEENLRNYIEIYLKEVTVREGRIRALYVIMGESLAAVPEIRKEIDRLDRGARDGLEQIVQTGINQGEFRKSTNPEASAVLILGMLRGVVMQYLVNNKALNVKKMLPLIQQAAISGLK